MYVLHEYCLQHLTIYVYFSLYQLIRFLISLFFSDFHNNIYHQTEVPPFYFYYTLMAIKSLVYTPVVAYRSPNIHPRGIWTTYAQQRL